MPPRSSPSFPSSTDTNHQHQLSNLLVHGKTENRKPTAPPSRRPTHCEGDRRRAKLSDESATTATTAITTLLHQNQHPQHPQHTPMKLSIAPAESQPSEVRNTQFAPAAPSAPGLVDTLRAQGPVSIASQLNNRHPIESRILNWEENTTRAKTETHRRVFGMADPIKREMELNIVKQSEFRPQVLGGSSNIHSDILLNKDTSIDWEDVYTHSSDLLLHNTANSSPLHTEMEHTLRI